MAMEGNGPAGGTPKNMGLLMISTDPVALDATVCRLIDLDPLLVPTIKLGAESGSGVYRQEDIEIIGIELEKHLDPSFNISRKPLSVYQTSGLFRFFLNRLVPKPVIQSSQCIRCGICVKVCPAKPKALLWTDEQKRKPPVYQYKHCIRCYCCQELCPESAIKLKKPLFRRIFLWRLS